MIPPPFIIVAKIHSGEAPYLRSFCNHYLRIGTDRLVLVVASESTAETLRPYLPEDAEDRIRIVVTHDNMDLDPVVKGLLREPGFEDSMVALFDCDEYLQLPPGIASLTQLWLEQRFEYLQLPWLLVSCDDEKTRDFGFWSGSSRQGKYIVRSDKVSVFGTHIAEFQSGTRVSADQPLEGLRLVHYSGRTLNDTVLKIVLPSSFPKSGKNIHLDSLNALRVLGDLPPRLKIHAYLCLHDCPVPNNDLLAGAIDLSAEKSLLAQTDETGALSAALVRYYYFYKKQLMNMGFSNDQDLYPGKVRRILDLVVDQKLPVLSLAWDRIHV